MEEKVILVDEQDNPIGLMEKLEAHQKALLHRAFSVFILNDKGEIMLQQRAANKYHSPNLWTNTCCSHPREGETTIEAGKRRLQEEMGFVTELSEHELDHILIGYYNNSPIINPDEVSSWRWESPKNIKADITKHPHQYTEWFKIIFDKFYNQISQ